MNLVIDAGNSRIKISVFNSSELIHTFPVENIDAFIIEQLCTSYQTISKVIISAVRDVDSAIIDLLKSKFSFVICLSEKTKLPIANLYKTPATLGNDRMAAAFGANYLFPDRNLLIIDAGSAITFDMVSEKNEFVGGNISPGLEMRFKALNQFTAKLPYIQEETIWDYLGTTTETAIRIGVQNGILFEVQRTIELFKENYRNLQVILTGGDSKFFERSLKNYFFADSNLVSIGLNRILEYNV